MSPLVAVTGAAGFLGRPLVHALSSQGYRVRAIVREPPALRFPDGVEVAVWDTSTETPPAPVLVGVDAICHLAALKPRGAADVAAAAACLNVNALGTLRLLEAAASLAIPHFVNVSAGNAYRGAVAPIDESGSLYPSGHGSYYLTSKVCAEIWVSHFAEHRGLSACNLRPSAVYGPRMGNAGLIPNLIRSFSRRERVTLTDQGEFRADFVYVEDVARAVVAALAQRATGTFNVGSGQTHSTLEIARIIARVLDRQDADSDITLAPATGASLSPGFAALDVGRARAVLGYVPTSIVDGLRATVSAYLGLES